MILEIMQPLSGRWVIKDFLESNGEGINHLCFEVADLATERAQLEAMGVKNVRGNGPNALHLDDVFGYDVEICGLANNALTDGA